MIDVRDLFEKDMLFQAENYIFIALTYYYIGKGYDLDDIKVCIEAPERYDQHSGKNFYISIKVDNITHSVYLDCDGEKLKGNDKEEIIELKKLINQFNDWFKTIICIC